MLVTDPNCFDIITLIMEGTLLRGIVSQASLDSLYLCPR